MSAASAFVANGNPVRAGIVDISQVPEIGISAAFIRNFVEARAPILPWKPRVVVAPQTAGYGLARMFQILREGQGDGPIHVARTMGEAWEYLGLESPEFLSVEHLPA